MNARRIERLAGFSSLVALGTVVIAASCATWIWFGQDFIAFYTSTRLVLLGDNPYDYARIVPNVLETIGVGGNSAFYYPLWFTFPLLPLVSFPFQWSRLAWLTASVLSWAMSVWLTERAYRFQSRASVRWLVWLFSFVLLGWFTLKVEQVAFLLFLDLAICLWAIEAQRVKTASFAMALLLTKPNVTFLLFGFLVLCLWSKERKIVIGAAVTIFLLLAISKLVLPNWWTPIVEGHLPNGLNQGLTGYQIDARRLTTTTSDFLDYELGIVNAPAVLIQAGIALFAVVVVWRWRAHILFGCVLALTMGFLITPYAMQYDYALLTPAFLWVLYHIPRLNESRGLVVLAGLVFLASILLWEKPISDGLWIPLTLTALLLITAPSVHRELALAVATAAET
jgi:hypothetical protein